MLVVLVAKQKGGQWYAVGARAKREAVFLRDATFKNICHTCGPLTAQREKKDLHQPRIELGTFRVSGGRPNQLDHRCYVMYISR